MKNIFSVLFLFFIINTLQAKDYKYFSHRKGQVVKTDGSRLSLNELTLMEWDWNSGRIKGCCGVLKLKCKNIEIEMKNVRSMEFSKEKDSDPKWIRFMVNVTMRNGSQREFLVQRFYDDGRNVPYYSFVGKSDFGVEEAIMWKVKRVEFYD